MNYMEEYNKLKKKYNKIKQKLNNVLEYLDNMNKFECNNCNNWTDCYYLCDCNRCNDSFCDKCKDLYLVKCIECKDILCQKCIYPYNKKYIGDFICNECISNHNTDISDTSENFKSFKMSEPSERSEISKIPELDICPYEYIQDHYIDINNRFVITKLNNDIVIVGIDSTNSGILRKVFTSDERLLAKQLNLILYDDIKNKTNPSLNYDEDISETSETSETSDMSDTSDNSKVFKIPGISKISDTPDNSKTFKILETTEISEISKIPELNICPYEYIHDHYIDINNRFVITKLNNDIVIVGIDSTNSGILRKDFTFEEIILARQLNLILYGISSQKLILCSQVSLPDSHTSTIYSQKSEITVYLYEYIPDHYINIDHGFVMTIMDNYIILVGIDLNNSGTLRKTISFEEKMAAKQLGLILFKDISKITKDNEIIPMKPYISSLLSTPLSSLSLPSSTPLSSLSSPSSIPLSSSLSSPSSIPLLSPLSSPSSIPLLSPLSSPLSIPLSSPLSSPLLIPLSSSSPSSTPSSTPLSTPLSSSSTSLSSLSSLSSIPLSPLSPLSSTSLSSIPLSTSLTSLPSTSLSPSLSASLPALSSSTLSTLSSMSLPSLPSTSLSSTPSSSTPSTPLSSSSSPLFSPYLADDKKYEPMVEIYKYIDDCYYDIKFNFILKLPDMRTIQVIGVDHQLDGNIRSLSNDEKLLAEQCGYTLSDDNK